MLQALSLAGGVTDRGLDRRGSRSSASSNGEKQELKVKLADMVQPGDTIIVRRGFSDDRSIAVRPDSDRSRAADRQPGSRPSSADPRGADAGRRRRRPTRVDGRRLRLRHDLPARRDVHLLDYVKVLYKRRWTAVTAFLLVFVSRDVYTFTATPIYEARSSS